MRAESLRLTSPRHQPSSPARARRMKPVGGLTGADRAVGRNGSLAQMLGPTWRRHRLTVLATLASTALVLGFIGSLSMGSDVLQAAYDTIAMLTFNYVPPPGEETPLAIGLARVMAPAVTAYATVAALTAVLEEKWQQLRAQRLRRHAIVCGLGDRGMRLVRAYRDGSRPARVVAIERDAANTGIATARRLGALVVLGDAADQDTLRLAGVRRAAELIAVCSDEAMNAQVANAARALGADDREPLAIFCHGSSGALVGALTGLTAARSSEGVTCEWFNVTDRAARLLLADHARLETASAAGLAPHIAVAGDGELAERLLVNAARQWRLLQGSAGRLRATVVSPTADRWVRGQLHRHPALASTVDLEALDLDLCAPPDREAALTALGDASVVFVCAATDSASLEGGLGLAHAGLPAARIVVTLAGVGGGLRDLLPADSCVKVVPIVDRACSLELITDSLTETLARALHGIYVEHATVTGDRDAEKPLTAYDELSEEMKEANRAQSRDLALKLHDLGCGLRPLEAWDGTLVEFTADEVERLAEAEHERWNRDRKARGWRSGPCTDHARKINQWIDVPWAELPDSMREYDRIFIRGLPRALAGLGYEAHRLDSPSRGFAGALEIADAVQ
jgi:hypothetical protein